MLSKKKFPYFILFLACLLSLAQIAVSSDTSTLDSIPGSECEGKKQCVIVFKAPWCGACRATIPFVKTLREMAKKEGDFGVQVVIGLDSEAGIKSMTQMVGEPVHADPEGSLFHSLGGGGVPRWGVIDEKGNILLTGSGLPRFSELNDDFRKMARERFGLQKK